MADDLDLDPARIMREHPLAAHTCYGWDRITTTACEPRRLAEALAGEPKRRRAAVVVALEAAKLAWQYGAWADAPRYHDRVQERLAQGQYVTDWLAGRARAAAAEGPGADTTGSLDTGNTSP